MSTITHPVLLIMAQGLASVTNKSGTNIRNLFQNTILIVLKSVITAVICTTLL